MCCHHQKAREDNIFHVLLWLVVEAALSIFGLHVLG
jgi:hypothetical protein